MTAHPPTSLAVALVHPFAWSDVRRGGERYFRDLGRWLASRGHRVDAVTGTWGAAATHVEDGVAVHRLAHRLPRRLEHRGVSVVDTFGAVALPFLLTHRYDLVHALTPTAALAARLTGHRVVLTALGHPTPDQFGLRPLDRAQAWVGVRAASLPVAFSAASAQRVRAMFGRDCGVLPLGVRTEDFTPDLAPRTGPARLLFAAFPGDPRKGVDLALRAMPRVLDRHPDARLLLPGEPAHHATHHDRLGPDRERVLAAVDDLGVRDMDEMPAIYRSATVSLLPSRHEALGISLAESLACGTPVVCSDDGGMPSIVDRPSVGRVFAPDDVEALSSALVEAIALAADRATPPACVQSAWRYDWETVVGPMHEQAYRRLLDRRRVTAAR